MKNIIILSLNKKLNLYRLGPLIESIKNHFERSHISLLIDSKNKKYAKIFTNVDSIHEVNKTELKTIMSKEIYSNT